MTSTVKVNPYPFVIRRTLKTERHMDDRTELMNRTQQIAKAKKTFAKMVRRARVSARDRVSAKNLDFRSASNLQFESTRKYIQGSWFGGNNYATDEMDALHNRLATII